MPSGNADRSTDSEPKSWEKRHPVLTNVIAWGTLSVLVLFIGVCTVAALTDDGSDRPLTGADTPAPLSSKLSESPENQRTVAAPEPTPTATVEPGPEGGFSAESLELRAALQELIRIKDEPWFHIYCFAIASPAYEWAEYMKSANDITVLSETGVTQGDIVQLGSDYCRNEGRETEYTRMVVKEFMNPDWVNVRPIPTPNANVRIVADRTYQAVSEQLAECVWGNPEAEELFEEYIERSPDMAQFALLHESSLEKAKDTEIWDATMTILAMCEE